MCYFQLLFCLFNVDNSIDWADLYNEILKQNHITDKSRGYKPAHALEELAKRIFSLFFDAKAISYDELLSFTIELFYFLNRHGTGSCNDFGAISFFAAFSSSVKSIVFPSSSFSVPAVDTVM